VPHWLWYQAVPFGDGVEAVNPNAKHRRVVVLWYLLGRLLGRRGSVAAPKQRQTTATRLSEQLLVMIWGACLFFGALQSFRDPGRYNNPVGNLAQGILLLAWSFVLVILPGLTLATVFVADT
jgi:hypothetical protein